MTLSLHTKPSHGLYTQSDRGAFGCSLMKIYQKVQEILSGHKFMGKSHDLDLESG